MVFLQSGCNGGAGPVSPPDGDLCFGAPVAGADGVGSSRSALTIDELVGSECSTAVVRDLSEQLVAELECIMPGQMSRIDDVPGLSLGGAVFPWLQTPARNALARAALGGGTLPINSGLRTLPQQYLLYRWYQAGRCGIALAASPGRSNHESGLAIDTSAHAEWRSRLEAAGFEWLGSSDPVHFDYAGPGTANLSGLSVRAFQRLWNRNHAEDPIAEDGVYGPQTEARLSRSPSEGFPVGACAPMEPMEPMEPLEPLKAPVLAIDWTLEEDGVYTLAASAPESTERVLYLVDGREIADASVAYGPDFRAIAGVCADGAMHLVEARALDMEGNELAHARAWLEARPDAAVYVRPRGEATYEIGVERPPPETVSVEVSVDGYPIEDAVSGETPSARGAVLYTFTLLGSRQIVVRMLDAAGGVIEERAYRLELR